MTQPDQGTHPDVARETVLVTGAAGFLGSHVVELLSRIGSHEVIATDLAASERSEALEALPGVTFRTFDLRDTAELESAVADSGLVVHLAGALTSTSATNIRAALDINVGITHDLAALSARHRIRHFFYGSSQATYGTFQQQEHEPYLESDVTLRPGLNMYGASKIAAEVFLNAFADTGGVPFTALRFGTIYGPRINPMSNGAILLRVLDAVDKGEVPTIAWAKDALHALVYVQDAADATVRALTVCPRERAINVVGDPVSSELLYERAMSLYGADPAQLVWESRRTRYQRVSRALMREVLGYEPATSLNDGLAAVIAWHRETSPN